MTGRAAKVPLEEEIRGLSGGQVARITAEGPVFGRRPPARSVRPDTFVRVLSGGDQARVLGLAVSWALAFAWFWVWWLRPEHRVGWAGLIINSVLLLYLTALPFYFLMTVSRLKRVNPALEIPALPVAFVVTRAPSEEWCTVRRTLEAMSAQVFPHPYDVWLCDEDPTEEILTWCRHHDVHVSCRRGVPAYHRATWPRRTRCKEGNLAYFYDRWGYQDYAVVSQLDCDHVPAPTYLAQMVRAFADPAIGYVAAPSVCDVNAAQSWSARGRLYREAVWHGAVQLGHSDGLAPMCIGSHYAVRTAALRDIGGLGPELAEDFSTTLLLNSAGWHGAFAIDAEAHGDGPLTFADMVTQEYQWSRSLTLMLFGLIWHHVGRIPFLRRLRFAYALGYYPLLALTVLAGLSLPPIAVLTGLPWMNVNYFDFLVHFWFMPVWVFLALCLMRRRGLLRPPSAPVISWEVWLFALARWPYIVWGVLGAVRQRMRPRPVTFKVTPKRRSGLEPLMTRLVLPFAALAVSLAAVALFGELTRPAVGYVFLTLLGALVYGAVALAVPLLHIRETARSAGTGLRAAFATARTPLLVTVASALPPLLALMFFPAYAVTVLSW
ncbi:glycosyltransferase family 2 protein [Streptomyces ossamyceticus]|uniref:glycosyltransferase family 2 protein n=1 Tax=Streptomyces ossamyceticus TaxID=249581 RepID=UPI000AA6C035|nr:glycosyltransferase [Streptomyces ossamyceticus]